MAFSFFFFCYFFYLLKTFEYGVPMNCSICNVNANFEFILLFPLTICKLSWYIKVIIMADWFIYGIVIQHIIWSYLTNFRLMLHFYTIWKHQKTGGFLMLFREYRSGTLVKNGLIKKSLMINFVSCSLFIANARRGIPANNINTRTTCEIYSRLTIKTPELQQWLTTSALLLLTLNRFHLLSWCFHYRLWTSKCQLDPQ